MKSWTVIALTVLALGLGVTVGCGPSAIPVAASGTAPAGNDEQLPFDRQVQSYGISPTSAVIPPETRITAGTPITIHLRAAIASATAQSGDTFDAVLLEPIVVNGQTLAERGASVTGRVMEAKAAGHTATPGYLRLALSSISINGKTSPVQSSSNFVKGASQVHRKLALARNGEGSLARAAAVGGPFRETGSPVESASAAESTTGARDVTVRPDRRLTFRLTEPVPLHD